MPWRLVVLIVILGILLSFIGFNLNNTCDISFGFASFTAVPIFLTVFVSFILGMFCSLPFFLFRAFRKSKNRKGKTPEPAAGGGSGETGPYGID
ncbi:MAG: hypothetical protein LBC31_04555 [Treponema sp.]|jgi:uncharacterized integral membrane protein|nr:hypothetical protein [Treponema sp.]